MKKIGFIDYYLSEWHANNYPEWIRAANAEAGEDFEICYAWAELDASPLDGVTSAEWCEKNGVTLCVSIEELCEKSDYILILAPSNPEKHLGYAEIALRYGKNTYIDKTFAPDFAEAKKIFDIAEKYGAKFFSSSALRYATELDEIKGAKSIITTGGGSNMDEYIIHQAEMAVKLAASEPVRLRTEALGDSQRICTVEFASGSVARLIYAPRYAFSVNADCDSGENLGSVVRSDTFGGLIRDILRFYNDGTPSFNTEQTLWVMKIRGGAVRSNSALGEWVKL